MPTVIGLAGSVRKGSFNASLLAAAAQVAPSGLTIDIATIRGIPLYDGDIEREQGVPEIVVALKDRIAASDGLLLVTPEYNSGIPGVFKNAIDWLSRPDKDIPRVFGDKPVGLIGATPGRAGTRLSQTGWLPVLRTLGTRPWFGQQLYVAGARQVFDESGALIDPMIKNLLTQYMQGFAAYVAKG
jgi:chromate reductase, NAD(P)H dehydrogenase (quinone)